MSWCEVEGNCALRFKRPGLFKRWGRQTERQDLLSSPWERTPSALIETGVDKLFILNTSSRSSSQICLKHAWCMRLTQRDLRGFKLMSRRRTLFGCALGLLRVSGWFNKLNLGTIKSGSLELVEMLNNAVPNKKLESSTKVGWWMPLG